MPLIPLAIVTLEDGTIGAYFDDAEPAPHIWDNFDPSILLEAEKEKNKQKGSPGVAAPSSHFVVSSPAGVFPRARL